MGCKTKLNWNSFTNLVVIDVSSEKLNVYVMCIKVCKDELSIKYLNSYSSLVYLVIQYSFVILIFSIMSGNRFTCQKLCTNTSMQVYQTFLHVS